ncbi:MAG: hypothetical protein RLZZ210_226 [Pseudomonadota bacterium]|jgi:cell division protein FtsN
MSTTTNKGHVLLGLILGLMVAVFAALIAFMLMTKNASPVNDGAKADNQENNSRSNSSQSVDPNKSLYSKVPLSPVDDKKSPPLESSNIENSNPKANKSSEEVMQDIINHGIASNTEQVQKKKKKELPEYIDEFGERKIGKPTENAISVNNRNPEEQAKKPKPEVNPNTETDPIKSLLGDSNNKSKEDKKVIKTKAEKSGVFYVQVGSFKSDDQADRQKATLLMQGLHSNVVEAEREGSTVYRVRMGPFYSKKETDEIEKKLSHEAIPYKVIKTED